MTILERAEEYLDRGWPPVPIPLKSKAPRLRGWQDLRLIPATLPDYFPGEMNVGVLLGEPSGGLIDVDLDHPRAVELAGQYLPPTGAIFGRKGKLRSHWLYKFKQPHRTKKYQDKVCGMIVEVRGTGSQTVFPGSVHPSGEPVEWDCDGCPAFIDREVLLEAVAKLAQAVRSEQANSGSGQKDSVSSRGKDLLEGALQQAAIGNRNDTGFKLACRLRESGVSWSEAKMLMFRYAGGVPQGVGNGYTQEEALGSLKPINALVAEADQKYQETMSDYLGRQNEVKLKISVLEKRIKEAMFKEMEYGELVDELSSLKAEPAPIRRRYVANDTTVEKLIELLRENPNGLLLLRDELIGMLKYMERKGQESARAFYLEAWGGNGSHESDRIGRGSVRTRGACISIIGTIQPGPLQQYLKGALAGGAGDDGFIQRFQLAVWPEEHRQWRNVDRRPDREARNLAFGVFDALDKLDPKARGAECSPSDLEGIPFLRFGPRAQGRFNAWMFERENRLRQGRETPALEAHLAKYRSLIPSLALLIHLAEGGQGPVPHHALARAIDWGHYLESHSRRIYGQIADPAIGAAHALARRIQNETLCDGFTLRDLYRNHWAQLSDRADWIWYEGNGKRGTDKYCLAEYRMTGTERAMCYRLAVGTGLRASEIGSLTVESFYLLDPDRATVTVEAGYSKHRRTDVLPLRRDLAEVIKNFIADRTENEKVFRMPPRTADMIRFDMMGADIPKQDKSGRWRDFHALRHTFITRLARAGVPPAVTMKLAGHSTITLTMDYYTPIFDGDERNALDRLPAIGAVKNRKEKQVIGA